MSAQPIRIRVVAPVCARPGVKLKEDFPQWFATNGQHLAHLTHLTPTATGPILGRCDRRWKRNGTTTMVDIPVYNRSYSALAIEPLGE